MNEVVKVLLVDDEIDFINMMQYWLRQRGFEVDTLYSGEEAVGLVKQNNYHIMFLDLKLPGINGIEVLRGIREFSNIPVIIFSAYGSTDILKEATSLGISGFFAKERGFEEAAKLIQTALRLHKGLSEQEGGHIQDGA